MDSDSDPEWPSWGEGSDSDLDVDRVCFDDSDERPISYFPYEASVSFAPYGSTCAMCETESAWKMFTLHISYRLSKRSRLLSYQERICEKCMEERVLTNQKAFRGIWDIGIDLNTVTPVRLNLYDIQWEEFCFN